MFIENKHNLTKVRHRYVQDDLQCCSSHDLLAHLMNVACTVATERQNVARASMQTELQEQLFAVIDAWHEENNSSSEKMKLPAVDWSYDVMSKFTRSYIQSYMPDPSKQQDIRFLPFVDIDRTHSVHAKALEFQKAQDVLYGKCKLDCLREYDAMSYAELVQVSVVRVIESSLCV